MPSLLEKYVEEEQVGPKWKPGDSCISKGFGLHQLNSLSPVWTSGRLLCLPFGFQLYSGKLRKPEK